MQIAHIRASTPSRAGFLAMLPEQADLREVAALPRGEGRKVAAWRELSAVAERSHPKWQQFADALRAEGLIDRSRLLTSPNLLALYPVSGAEQAVLYRLRAAGIGAIYDALDAMPLIEAPAVAVEPAPRLAHARAGVGTAPWNLAMVDAAKANALGGTGAGMVYGSIDTGVDWTHESLRSNYRGARADGSVDHDYSWFDVGDPDWPTSSTPYDRQGHGTHTTSVAVGRPDAAETAVGVAPEATWIAVRTLVGSNRMEKILRAMQYMQAPTRVDGTSPRADLAPDVVGMSLDSLSRGHDVFHQSVANLEAAGILVSASAGNVDRAVGDVASPAQYPGVVAVTSVDRAGKLAALVPQGPSRVRLPDGSPAPKPDVAAPGVAVRGALPGNAYGEMSGTSMAQPHVAGAMLAMLSARPDLTPGDVRDALTATATDLGSPGTDPWFGAGLVNAARAVEAVLAPTREVSAAA